MDQVATEFRLLADPVRLRALRVLARQELSAGEASQVLGIAASTTSKQLGTLRRAGLVAERRTGRHVYFAVPDGTRTDPRWRAVLARLAAEPDSAGDLARLDDVLRARREARDEDSARTFVPGRSWTAWARALGCLVPPGLRVADLGCGEGALAVEIARFAGRVVGVDRREAAVRAARDLAKRQGVRNARFRVAEIERPGLPPGSFDVAVFSQSLHGVEDPARALAAARGLLASGGRILVLDLLPHDEGWVAERLGHRHLGFPAATLSALLGSAGFASVAVEQVAGRAGDPFKVVLATGTRP